jgi:hypothetical protein
MLNETWRAQYDRMQRSFALLQRTYGQDPNPQTVIPPRDVVYHFCSDAFHLRDWIAATLGTDAQSTNAIARQLDNEMIFPSPELSACGDIANGFKHLVLHIRSLVTGARQGHAEVVSHSVNIGAPTMHVRFAATASATVTHPAPTWRRRVRDILARAPKPAPTKAAPASAPVGPASDDGWVQDTFTIDINGQEHDALDVATAAVKAWDQWLQGNSTLAAQLP